MLDTLVIPVVLFVIKAVVLLLFIFMLIGFIAALASKHRQSERSGKLNIKKWNKQLFNLKKTALTNILQPKQFKKWFKQTRKKEKAALKKELTEPKGRIYVLDFTGDILASRTARLKKEISLLLDILNSGDEVLIRLHSPGGSVTGYGQAASELMRLRKADFKLTVAIDQIAASGGYLMACVANSIIAAPFSIVGSIGVIVMAPNFHRFLKKKDIDYQIYSAGKFKRTITLFGKNTKEGVEKLNEELASTHKIFQNFVANNRPATNIEQISSGEWWHAQDALNLKLVDEIATSEEYLSSKAADCDIFELNYEEKPAIYHRIAAGISHILKKIIKETPQNLDEQVKI